MSNDTVIDNVMIMKCRIDIDNINYIDNSDIMMMMIVAINK